MNIRVVLLFILSISGYSQNNLDKGLDFFEKGDYDNAIINFNQEIQNKSNLLKCYHNRGRSYYRIKNYYQASRDADKACQLGDCTLREYIISNNLYQKEVFQENKNEIKVDTSKNVGSIDLKKDIKRLEEIAQIVSKIQNQKKDKDKVIQKDINYYINRIELYDQKIRINDDIDAYYSKGLVLYNNFDYGSAISYFDRVIANKSDYSQAIYFYRGLANLNQEKYSESIDDFTEIILKKSNFNEVYYYRGFAYYKQEDYLKAIVDFTNMIEIDSNMEGSYYYRGASYDSENNYINAIKDFNRAIEINPKYENAYINRGYSYISLGKFFEASRDADKTCQMGDCTLKQLMKETEIYQ